jgi:hypothetical protein
MQCYLFSRAHWISLTTKANEGYIVTATDANMIVNWKGMLVTKCIVKANLWENGTDGDKLSQQNQENGKSMGAV